MFLRKIIFLFLCGLRRQMVVGNHEATKTSPFYALISSQEEIFEADIERGFPVFTMLFSMENHSKMRPSINLSQNHSDFTLTTTEEMFAKF